jgi:hypothetical protein
MKLTMFAQENEVFTNCECIQGYAFNNTLTRAKSALSPAICAYFGVFGTGLPIFMNASRLVQPN